jgi:hypothetical protein
MKRHYLLTPFLLTLAYLLNTYYWIARIASPDQLFRPLLLLWMVLGLLLFPAYWLTRNLQLASLGLGIFVFGFYFSESFFKVVGSIVLATLVVWILYSRIRGFKVLLDHLFILLNGVAASIIIFSLYLNIQSFAHVPWLTYWASVEQARQFSIDGVPSYSATRPDIYYIILDGYPRSDILKTLYRYDNSQFTAYLKNKGFIIPKGIHSNYGMTAVSVSSTLNMDYLDSYSPGLKESHFWWLMVPFIDQSRTRTFLESQGYKYISMSTWSMLDKPNATYTSRPFLLMLTDMERYLLGATPLGYLDPVLRNFASIPTYDTHRKQITHFFTSLTEIPRIAGPKFVFAHVTVPHPPFVFDGNGNPLDPPVNFNMNDAADFYGSDREYREGYVGQVEYTNTQMQTVVDEILKQSPTPPIIIIQADHGSAMLTDFESANNTCVQERFSPFAAYYLPGVRSEVIPSDLTNVNLFRIILNQYFDTDLPLLKNRQYYYQGRLYIFRTVDVTSRVDEECTVK